MRFSPPLQVLERGPGGEVSESPDWFLIVGVLLFERFNLFFGIFKQLLCHI